MISPSQIAEAIGRFARKGDPGMTTQHATCTACERPMSGRAGERGVCARCLWKQPTTVHRGRYVTRGRTTKGGRRASIRRARALILQTNQTRTTVAKAVARKADRERAARETNRG